MKKDLRIDGRMQRVFVLSETDERIAYIPLKSIHRVDYDRLNEISDAVPNKPILEQMRKTKLGNGRNALVQYDSVIQVADKVTSENGAIRLKKPEEAILEVEAHNLAKPPQVQMVEPPKEQTNQNTQTVNEEKQTDQPKKTRARRTTSKSKTTRTRRSTKTQKTSE